ncbi:MAG: glycosyltransferase family 4 protein [Acidobacteriia bacterium]|nr:glycosyltransferase family 4 protein [Terriglobia bacterium]
MRILIVNWHRNVIGGVEAYLRILLPALLQRGHELALVHGYPSAAGPEAIDPPAERLPRWCYQELGTQDLLRRVEQWRPDLVYVHVWESNSLESALLNRYPSVFFAHGYQGMCETGRKCQSWPRPTPCTRRFGPMCLILHYPARCGGLHPLTMLRNYRFQSQQNVMLGLFAAVVAASRYICNEVERNGVDRERVHLVPLPVTAITPRTEPPAARLPEGRLLMMGRLIPLKGADYLIRAIPAAARKLNRPLRLVIAGTGAEETILRHLASRLGVEVEFAGWVSGDRREEVITQSDLLAVPSLWPEPFGLVGLEAACLGVPAVGYAVGGIPEWLIPGVSGELAPGNPPTVEGLSAAIVRALEDHEHYHRLSLGAWKTSQQFSLSSHLDKLESVFNAVAGHRSAALAHDQVSNL